MQQMWKDGKDYREILQHSSLPEEGRGFRFSEWPSNHFAVPEDPTVLEEECGKFANFFVEREIFTVERSVITERHPNSLLAKSIEEAWESEPFSTIHLSHSGTMEFFPFVIELMTQGKVTLPSSSSLTKESFVELLNVYEIEVDHSKIESE